MSVFWWILSSSWRLRSNIIFCKTSKSTRSTSNRNTLPACEAMTGTWRWSNSLSYCCMNTVSSGLRLSYLGLAPALLLLSMTSSKSSDSMATLPFFLSLLLTTILYLLIPSVKSCCSIASSLTIALLFKCVLLCSRFFYSC